MSPASREGWAVIRKRWPFWWWLLLFPLKFIQGYWKLPEASRQIPSVFPTPRPTQTFNGNRPDYMFSRMCTKGDQPSPLNCVPREVVQCLIYLVLDGKINEIPSLRFLVHVRNVHSDFSGPNIYPKKQLISHGAHPTLHTSCIHEWCPFFFSSPHMIESRHLSLCSRPHRNLEYYPKVPWKTLASWLNAQ